jgi:hypothetical protein
MKLRYRVSEQRCRPHRARHKIRRMCTKPLYCSVRMCYKMDAPTIPGRDGHMAHAWKRGWHLATGPPYNRSTYSIKLESARAHTHITNQQAV